MNTIDFDRFFMILQNKWIQCNFYNKPGFINTFDCLVDCERNKSEKSLTLKLHISVYVLKKEKKTLLKRDRAIYQMFV